MAVTCRYSANSDDFIRLVSMDDNAFYSLLSTVEPRTAAARLEATFTSLASGLLYTRPEVPYIKDFSAVFVTLNSTHYYAVLKDEFVCVCFKKYINCVCIT